MPRSRSRFYLEKKRSSQTDSQLFDVDDDEDLGDEDLTYLEEIPYSSSSSADRSSIGSIPWADDAIKKNQVDWERVEQMLCGEEILSDDEPELKREILEWQRKFPEILSNKPQRLHMLQQNLECTEDTDVRGTPSEFNSILNLQLNYTDEDYDEYNENMKRPNGYSKFEQSASPSTHETNHAGRVSSGLAKLFQRGLHIRAVPLILQQRPSEKFVIKEEKEKKITESPTWLATSSSLVPMHSSVPQVATQYFVPVEAEPRPNVARLSGNQRANNVNKNENTSHSTLRMPPILNVLESKRRFQGLVGNRSFVQLTQVPQVKSAAVSTQRQRLQQQQERRPEVEQNNRVIYRSAWQPVLAATSAAANFSNNRNAIVLPALNMSRTYANVAVRDRDRDSPSSNTSSAYALGQRQCAMSRQRQRIYMPSTSTTTPSTGRSISAAVTHTRTIYLPPSASSKYEMFN